MINNQSFSEKKPTPKLITFYLPQFHPTAENDQWWGKGFTEWINVTKAMPLFKGHYQPHLPTDFGFYDLRVREIRHEQIKMAKNYGIDGFCYHYYWFSGKRILNLPLDDMLADPESDMPYCLCWANENWTRRWDASEDEILIAQRYLPEDDLGFIKSLIPFFKDKRYIFVDGRPFLIVYRPQHMPDAPKTVQVWRDYCRSIGLGEIHICAALTHSNEDYAGFGFDSGVEFPPHNLPLTTINNKIPFFKPHKGFVFEYSEVLHAYLKKQYKSPNVFFGVTPSWDNTARINDRACILFNSSPDSYEYWLSAAIRKTQDTYPNEQRMIFINAWNEWAEGCHLEPDIKYGHKFLSATLNAKLNPNISREEIKVSFPSINESRSFFTDLKNVISEHLHYFFSSNRSFLTRFHFLYSVSGAIRAKLRR